MNVSVAYAKNNLSELLKAVENGATVTISRYNKVVARLVSSNNPKPIPKLGTGKGRVKILDPNWAKPMSKDELERFLETGRY